MAKLEESKVEVIKKTKAKKRKHTSERDDDEVASKSLILETQPQKRLNDKISDSKPLKKSEKRKSQSQLISKEKRLKSSTNDGVEPDEDDDVDFEQPSMEQLAESEKPENTKAILTVRQKKKLKHQERMQSNRSESSGKEKQRNEEYLRKWKHSKNEWKFEKLRQISIQQSIFDEQKIDTELWPLALEYLSGSKGAAKDKITKLADEIIEKLDKECAQVESDLERKKIVDSVGYQRARDLLQSFD